VLRLLVTANIVLSSLILPTLMIEAIRSSETLVLTRATGCRIPGGGILLDKDCYFLCSIYTWWHRLFIIRDRSSRCSATAAVSVLGSPLNKRSSSYMLRCLYNCNEFSGVTAENSFVAINYSPVFNAACHLQTRFPGNQVTKNRVLETTVRDGATMRTGVQQLLSQFL
jgi:hypothetical protein